MKIAVESYLLYLAEATCAVYGLRIDGGIRVRIIENDPMSSRQIDSQPTSTYRRKTKISDSV